MSRRLTKRNCLICGAEFESRTTRQTCSRECQNKLPKDYECVCVICGKSFYSHKPNAKGCSPECRKKNAYNHQEKSHKKNIEARKKLIRNSTKKYRSNLSPEKKKELLEKNYEWRKKNPERWKALVKRDCEKHPERVKAAHRRRTHNFRNAGKLPENDIVSKRINHFGGCCYCDRIENLTLEHLIPIAKGGTNLEGNLYGACKSCNSSKQDKPWRTWYRKQRFYKPEREMEIRRMSLTLVIYRSAKSD